ncbi:MAG: hypothetical protein Q4F34_06270 [Prevotellaceae bacterium]|nr:hypothetical protein [Prevotellaceae bacterium]
MKQILTLIAVAILICSCSNQISHKCISTLPSGISIESLTDCTVPASFNTNDFNWRGSNLTMTVYNEDLYDAVEVSQMQVGDTLIYEDKPMIVESIADENGIKSINGGLEEGGAWLISNGGGTFRATIFDDHSVYTTLGKTQIPLSDNLLIIDCGENPDDPSDTICINQKQYIESLQGYRQDFNCLNTKVLIESGTITEIQRRWIP